MKNITSHHLYHFSSTSWAYFYFYSVYFWSVFGVIESQPLQSQLRKGRGRPGFWPLVCGPRQSQNTRWANRLFSLQSVPRHRTEVSGCWELKAMYSLCLHLGPWKSKSFLWSSRNQEPFKKLVRRKKDDAKTWHRQWIMWREVKERERDKGLGRRWARWTDRGWAHGQCRTKQSPPGDFYWHSSGQCALFPWDYDL